MKMCSKSTSSNLHTQAKQVFYLNFSLQQFCGCMWKKKTITIPVNVDLKFTFTLIIKPVFNIWLYIFITITVNVFIVQSPRGKLSGMTNLGLTLLCNYIATSFIHGLKKGDMLMGMAIIHFPLPCREEFLNWVEERRVWGRELVMKQGCAWNHSRTSSAWWKLILSHTIT